MIALVAPEPAPWIAPVARSLRRHGPVRVFAPWGVGVRAALALWARRRTDRVMVARYLRRRATDAMAAWWLDHLAEDVRLVVAPSLSSRRAFAVAAARGLPRVLVEDLPGLREVHDDLDRAARRWPESPLLRRYRAPAAVVAHQEAERVLADLLVVGGQFAEEQRRARGLGAQAIAVLPAGPGAVAPRGVGRRSGPTLLLAGLAAARHGVLEALEATRMIPGATLLVRPGEGAEPTDLLARPQVRRVSAAEREELAGVDLVLAPAWCECYPPEVPLAARLGVPVVATRRAAGAVSLARAGAEVEPGDASALARAIAGLWRAPRRPLPASPGSIDAALDLLLAPSPRRLRVL